MDISRNDVERLLSGMHAGRIEPEDFARQLLDLQVFLPVQDEKHQIAGFQLSTKARPLVIEDEDGNRVLVVFSSPERAKVLSSDYPDYSGGLLTEVSWIIRRMGADLGFSINPGMDPGFDFDPDMVAMLAGLLPEEAE
ncbi:MAG TPA: SseB family protein [Thiobacillaceae bacterium]|nr:SseB family protein [Thiobacillaceae bacterium]HNU65249.1 SseB family protein [Thiobacillaceae bacterium]